MFRGTLIRSGNNAKTVKGDGEFETAIMYLAPFTMAGANVCPMAELAGCIKGCLNTAGRGAFNNVQLARIAKTKRYLNDRKAFMAELAKDVAAFVRYCDRKGVKPAVRLNGTSDIQWEVAHPVDGFKSIFEAFPQVRFYDYTKVYKRAYRDLPANYALTLSFSAANPAYANAVIAAGNATGMNVAVVYRDKAMRDALVLQGFEVLTTNEPGPDYITRSVIDGDETDMRFFDPQGVIVGLYAKGKAKLDRSGFVVG